MSFKDYSSGGVPQWNYSDIADFVVVSSVGICILKQIDDTKNYACDYLRNVWMEWYNLGKYDTPNPGWNDLTSALSWLANPTTADRMSNSSHQKSLRSQIRFSSSTIRDWVSGYTNTNISWDITAMYNLRSSGSLSYVVNYMVRVS